MPPAYLRISVRRERASGTTDESREIGIIGGTVGGVVGRTDASRDWTTRVETRWLGDALVFSTINFNGTGPRTGDWSERRETWSLRPSGRLRVEIVREARDQPSETATFLYRRE